MKLSQVFTPITLINGDFLDECSADSLKFDCIVMNPPFGGKMAALVKLALDRPRCVPIEAAFVLKAVRLLQPGGRLLAIVPASLVSCLTTQWVRRQLIACGALLYVHELSRGMFKGVEARFYVVVFEAGRTQSTVVLSNHDFSKPATMSVRAADLFASNFRFDYAFHHAQGWFSSLRSKYRNLEWRHLSDVSRIWRGRIASPRGKQAAIHTCDHLDGFWSAPRDRTILIDSSPSGVSPGDLLMKRVGRSPTFSLAPALDLKGYACSDCLLLLRPRALSSVEMLFILRVLLCWPIGAGLVERGTGANYITAKELGQVLVPVNFTNRFPKLFLDYQRAVNCRDFVRMTRIEGRVRGFLERKIAYSQSSN